MTTKHSHADAKENAADTAGEAGNKLTEVFENTKEFVANVRDKAVATAKATDKTVHKHPYKSIAVVAGVGLAIGYIIGCRHSSKKDVN